MPQWAQNPIQWLPAGRNKTMRDVFRKNRGRRKPSKMPRWAQNRPQWTPPRKSNNAPGIFRKNAATKTQQNAPMKAKPAPRELRWEKILRAEICRQSFSPGVFSKGGANPCRFLGLILPVRRIKTVWPSGLRRWLQAPVCKGVGSNPTAVINQLSPHTVAP